MKLKGDSSSFLTKINKYNKIKYDWIFSSVISQIISNFVVDMHQTVSLQTVLIKFVFFIFLGLFFILQPVIVMILYILMLLSRMYGGARNEEAWNFF